MKIHQLIQHAKLSAKFNGKAHVMRRPSRPRRPLAIELSYAKFLQARLSTLHLIMSRVLLPRLEPITKAAGVRLDDWVDDLDQAFSLIRSTYFAVTSQDELEAAVERFARETSTFQKSDLTRILNNAAGVNVFFEDKALLTRMKAHVQQNVDLISSIDEDLLYDVKTRITTSVRAGDRVEEIRDMIEDRYEVSKGRAALIARDQTGKFYGQLNRERQTSIGVNQYTWRGVEDSKERETHRDLEGEVFTWGDPPITNDQGDRNEPGGDYQCRCTAEPVLPSFVPDYEEEAVDGLS